MIKLNSPARITLSLDIVRKLPNNLHELSVIKQTISLHDEITVEEAPQTTVLYENAPIENDIVHKMIKWVKKQHNIKKDVIVHIKKNIPLGSGLAGGSSNASTVLKVLNELWQLKLDTEQLIALCRKIGQDCPYFIYGGTCYDTEAGGVVKPLPPLLKHYVLLIYSGFKNPTNKMYSWIDYTKINQHHNTAKILLAYKKPDFDITKHLHNDFEAVVFERHPELEKLKQELLHSGLAALMTGSGSTLFALSKDKKAITKVYTALKQKYPWVYLGETV